MMALYEPVKKLSRLHMNIQQTSASADRIFELLDVPVAIRNAPHARPLEGPLETLAFEHVDFAYDRQPVLRDIHVAVRAGERVALVGNSGAGKTTLVNLIPRFYDVTGGRLALNGRDIRDLTLESLRSRIGLVTQETFLFNDTVAANIAYGHLDSSRAAIEEAARRAHAHEFIQQMPLGYETVIGERGVRLSGGQCQRLAIARAILKDAPILVLDEATSALDSEVELAIQEQLLGLMEGKTVIAIAHRLSTIARMDRLVVLEAGRIVEEGNHDALLAQKGHYHHLYTLQIHEAHVG